MLRGDVNALEDEDQLPREIGVACTGGGAGKVSNVGGWEVSHRGGLASGIFKSQLNTSESEEDI